MTSTRGGIAHAVGRRRFPATTGLTVVGAVVGAVLGPRAVDARLKARPSAPGRLLLDRRFAAVHQVAGGVYATIARPERGPQATSNGGVVVGKDAVLILEGHYHPSGAALEIEVARRLSRAPIRAAVNSHYHFDHTLGNSRYAVEKIPIVGHELARAKMHQIYGR